MSFIALILLAFSMSADAFAVTIVKGASCRQNNASYIIKTALIFGIVEAITPLIGWSIGSLASHYIEAYDHWIALILLSILGSKMIYESLQSDLQDSQDSENLNLNLKLDNQNHQKNIIEIKEINNINNFKKNNNNCNECTKKPNQNNYKENTGLMIITAIATGIDSMIVGVSLAFMDVNIGLISLLIGVTTTLMAILGLKLGCMLGVTVGKRAEMFGGIVLIGMGVMILCDHLGLI